MNSREQTQKCWLSFFFYFPSCLMFDNWYNWTISSCTFTNTYMHTHTDTSKFSMNDKHWHLCAVLPYGICLLVLIAHLRRTNVICMNCHFCLKINQSKCFTFRFRYWNDCFVSNTGKFDQRNGVFCLFVLAGCNFRMKSSPRRVQVE